MMRGKSAEFIMAPEQLLRNEAGYMLATCTCLITNSLFPLANGLDPYMLP